MRKYNYINTMYLPALIILGVFIYYPFMQGVIVSLKEWNGYSAKFAWVGLQKYARLFTDKHFARVFYNTMFYGIGSTLFQNVLGLALALLVQKESLGSRFIRTLIYLPAIISPLIMGYVWHFFFKYDGGAFNDILFFFKVSAVDWLADGDRGTKIITIVNTYQFVGVAMIIFLAGLKTISKEYREAALIDGANSLQRFVHVTFPMLNHALTVSLVINIIGGLKLFDVIYSLTGGGPGYQTSSISTMIREVFFVRQDAGYAAAMGNVMFLIILVITLAALRLLKKREVAL